MLRFCNIIHPILVILPIKAMIDRLQAIFIHPGFFVHPAHSVYSLTAALAVIILLSGPAKSQFAGASDAIALNVRASESAAENPQDFRNNHVFIRFYGQSFPMSIQYQRYLGSFLGGNSSVKVGSGAWDTNYQTINIAAMIEYPLFWRYFAGYGIGYNYRVDRTEKENFDAGISLHLNRRAFGEEIITYGVSLNFGAILFDHRDAVMKNDFPFLINDRFIFSIGFHMGIGF